MGQGQCNTQECKEKKKEADKKLFATIDVIADSLNALGPEGPSQIAELLQGLKYLLKGAVSLATVAGATEAIAVDASTVADISFATRSVEESLQEVAQIRQTLNVGGNRNIAFADYEINGIDGKLIGVSGVADRAGTVGMPGARIFETITTSNGNPRTADAEVKILENLASELSENSSGTINLFSERPFCVSCSSVVAQFKEKFPNIILNISSGPAKE